LKLKYDNLLSSFAFDFNLRRYTMAFPPPYEGVMAYMSMWLTIPQAKDVAVFSNTGNRTVASEMSKAAAAAKMAVVEGYAPGGVCVVPASDGSGSVAAPLSLMTMSADATSTGDEKKMTNKINNTIKNENMDTDMVMDGGFVTLSPDGNFTMQWAFVDGGKNVAFKLRLQEHTWMAIGIHRAGGSGMPGADMVGRCRLTVKESELKARLASETSD
jgi:hypothetical protein